MCRFLCKNNKSSCQHHQLFHISHHDEPPAPLDPLFPLSPRIVREVMKAPRMCCKIAYSDQSCIITTLHRDVVVSSNVDICLYFFFTIPFFLILCGRIF